MTLRLVVFLQFFLIGLLTSCGNVSDFFEKAETYDDKEIAHMRKGTPILYPRADPSCSESNALADVRDESGAVKVWISRHGEMSLVSVKVSALSGHGLQSEAIANTLWGHEVSYDVHCFTNEDRKTVCEETKINIRKEGQTLFFCQKGGGYPRESLENVALASMIGIIKTFDVHKSLFPEESVEKVTLLAHPLIYDHQYINNERVQDSVSIDIEKVRTDNAYWFPNDQNKYFIATIPESVEANASVSKPRIWEMPAITSHEYGHHLFQHYASSLADPLGSDLVSYSPHIHLVTSAINESFADLLAYFTYLLEYKEFGWFSVDNNYFSREVSKRQWSDGTLKNLSEWFLDHYFKQTPNLYTSKHEANPTDNHAVGAVIAHGLYRIFKGADGKPSDSELREGFRRTIFWSKRMKDSFVEDAKQHAYDFLESTVLHGLFVVKQNNLMLEADRCSALDEVFPVFEKLKQNCRGS